MGIRHRLQELTRRRPALSIVLLVGSDARVDRAVRTLLNQRPGDVEILALVSPDCPAAERAALTGLARRTRRIREIDGGLAAALGAARGRALTVFSAADAAARDGYGRASADGAVHFGGHRPLGQGAGAPVPGPHRLGGIAAAPALLDGFSPGRVLAPVSAWAGALTGGRDVSPDLAARAAALRLLADTEDITVESRDLVLTGTTRQPSWEERLAALADEIAGDRHTLAGRDSTLLAALHHRAILDLATDAPAQSDAAVARLRRLAREVLPTDPGAPLWAALPLPDRLLLWVLAHADAADLFEVLASRGEDTPAVPLTLEHGALHATPPVLTRITLPPTALLAVTDADLCLRQAVRTCAWIDGERLRLDGWGYVPGLDPASVPAPEIVLLPSGQGEASDVGAGRAAPGVGREVVRADMESSNAPDADLDADDPWRSYASSGYRAVLNLAGAPAEPMYAQLRLRVGDRLLTQPVPPPLGSRRPRVSSAGWSMEADGESLAIRPARPGELQPGVGKPAPGAVVVASAHLDGDRLRLAGPGPAPADLTIAVASAGGTFPLATDVTASGAWSAELDLADPALPSGGYRLRWSGAGGEGRCAIGAELDGPPTELAGRSRRVRLRPQPDGHLDLSVIVPVAPQHRSRYGHRLLIEEEWGPLLPGIFFETFGGKSAGDNPGAIRDELLRRGVSAPLWVSVQDGTVPVPAGVGRIVVGTPEWFRALRTARLLVVNDHLPHWFSKRSGQTILQTWHGTPIKHLLNDAPRASVTLPYRRLMARQVPQWDLLLAQTSDAAEDLRHGLGYTGEMLVGEQPRNAGLLGGTTTAQHVRARLGIAPGDPVILYAPTWREDLRRPRREAPLLLDAAALARATGAVVLVRSHHMNALPGGGACVLDVSRYESLEALMLAADLLITDYSSVIHDWGLTGRPALLHVPDLETYRERERGFYRDWPDDSGLPVSRTQVEAEARAAELLAGGPVPAAVDPASIRASLDAVCAWIDTVLPGAVPARPGEEDPHE